MTKAKKKVKTIKKNDYSNDSEISKLIKLVIIVSIIVLLFYGLTVLVNRKDEVEETDTPASIQYDEILIGNILKQPNDEYYVMVYNSDDYNADLYNIYLQFYAQKEDSIRVYTSQLNNPINQKFKSDKANLNVSSIEELKISDSTLFKIVDGKIEKTYVGESLKEYLSEISAEEEAE